MNDDAIRLHVQPPLQDRALSLKAVQHVPLKARVRVSKHMLKIASL